MGETSKKEKLLSRMRDFGQFRCPVCYAPLDVRAQSLICENRHSFDVNKKGFVNLALRQSESYYDEELFSARASVFDKGFYAPVLRALRLELGDAQKVLDAGCGEGYYLKEMDMPFGIGVDLSREAILRAARERQGPIWCVADLANLPFADASFDALLDVLSPANYTSFSRVLKPGGKLLKVIPGAGYLKEIREAMGLKSHDESRVAEHMRASVGISRVIPITKKYEVDNETWRDFLRMTPLTKHLSQEERHAIEEKCQGQITIDLLLFSARVP